ncbi:MAG: hypothetical protein ACFFBH_10700 [Promethearchaeota archaeon]
MSFGIVKNEKNLETKTEIKNYRELENILTKALIPFSKFLDKKREPDIYNGKEDIPFERRHPIFKALMRIEFEDRNKFKDL